MPDTVTSNAEETAARMRAIASELSAAGFDARLHETRASIDLTATHRAPGRRDIEAVIDEDGYVELRFWTGPGDRPGQVAAAIARVMAAVISGAAG